MYATSDGSAPNFEGSFGWASKTDSGIILVRNNGPAPGYRCSSFRAEAYGLLSYLLFVYHALWYMKTHISKKTKVFTDSESVLKRLEDMVEWTQYYSSATMQADWEVLQAIVRLLKQFEFRPELSHVPGHQDKKKDYKDLVLEAQLNVDADKLAGEYKYENDESPKCVPLIQGTVVALHSDVGTLASRFQRNIRKLSSLPAIKKYICDKNNWDK